MAENDLDIIEQFKNSHDDKYVLQLFSKYSFIPIIIFKNQNLTNEISKKALDEVYSEMNSILKKTKVSSLQKAFYEMSIKIAQKYSL